VTWQLGAFSILALALAGGFAWYERTRPDARIVALVATLAAFAALGRIAFAALPNVKPTSDIVLVSGYALGAAPGFVVGALAGLTSNFFFGQGPWTPWQMAAWGVTGMLGAWLAVLTGRRLGRWAMALVCAVSGFVFTATQDFGDWVTYSDHSLAQLGVYVGKGLGFDAIYAVSCLLFALAFAPALNRAIARFATRIQVRWEAVGPAAVALVVAAGVVAGQARAAPTPTSYLLAAQNPDGGYGPAPGQPSSGLYAGWVALGLAAEGINPQRVVKDGHSLAGYLESGGGGGSDPGSLERTILALRAAGLPATSELAALRRHTSKDGSVSEQSNLTAFAVLALRAAGVSPPATTIGWLTRQQDRDGGFNYATAGGASDVDDTGAVLEALARGGGRVRSRAVRFIESQQDSDGGFPAGPGAGSNAQSTAWAVQGLLAAGVGGLGGTQVKRALGYLSSLIAPDGHIRYSRSADDTPVWVTAEAVMALARKPLPLAPVALTTLTHARGGAREARRNRPRREIRHTQKRRHFAVVPSAAGLTGTLAAYVGLAEALALAPVDIG
jgi:prenyltransferase/squalene oxidase-like repeat protein